MIELRKIMRVRVRGNESERGEGIDLPSYPFLVSSVALTTPYSKLVLWSRYLQGSKLCKVTFDS